MTYIELINRYWKIEQQVQFSGIENKLFFALLNIANETYWKHEKLSVPNSKLLGIVGCSRKTLVNARQRLVKYNLIEFEPGHNQNTAPKYKIIHSACVDITRVENTRVNNPDFLPPNYPHIKDKDKYKNNNEYKNPETEQKHEKVYDFFRTHFKNHERIIKFLKQEEGLGEEFEFFMEYCLEGNEWGKYISKAKAPVKYILSIADKQWPYYQVWKGQQYKEATDFAGIGAFNISHVGYG